MIRDAVEDRYQHFLAPNASPSLRSITRVTHHNERTLPCLASAVSLVEVPETESDADAGVGEEGGSKGEDGLVGFEGGTVSPASKVNTSLTQWRVRAPSRVGKGG